MAKLVVNADMQGLSAALDYIESMLQSQRLGHKDIQNAMLLSEEVMVQLIAHAPEGGTFHIHVRKRLRLSYITISAPGQEFDLHTVNVEADLSGSGLDRSNENTIRSMLFKAYESRLVYSRKGKYNFVRITAGQPERELAKRTLTAFAAAFIVGTILHFLLSDAAIKTISDYLLTPVQEIFIRSLTLVCAPTVFFSIVSSIVRFSGFSDPGNVSAKVFIGYTATSIVAVFIGLGIFKLIEPGTAGILAQSGLAGIVKGDTAADTIVNTVINIVPTDIVTPFLNADTIQLIFLAVFCGLALGRSGGYSSTLRIVSDALDTLFSRIHELLSNLVPTAVFFSTVSIIVNNGVRLFAEVLHMLGTVLIALVVMVLLYLLTVLLFGLNPITFLRKYAPTMWSTFLLGSGFAAIPRTIRCCKNSLGISPKVYNFSIPFGAIANMDGNCIYLTVAGLFLAKLCGVEILGSGILTLVLTVVILSIGAPIAAGSVLLCLMVLLKQMNISPEAISLLLAVNACIEMLLAVSNTIGDVAITLTVAKSEKLLDIDVYRAKPKRR